MSVPAFLTVFALGALFGVVLFLFIYHIAYRDPS